MQLKIDGVGTNFILTPGKLFLIGKSNNTNAASKIVLQGDQSLESRHAFIEIGEDDTAYIVDLESSAGTFINERRLDSMIKVVVTTRDTLRFGLRVYARLNNFAEKSHDSSGFYDGIKNLSHIIDSSPNVSPCRQSSRVNFKHGFKIPTEPLSSSNKATSETCISPNNSANSTGGGGRDSPYIFETQYLEPRSSLESANEEDIYVPETQEIPAANYRPQTNNVAIVDERCANQCSANSSSQFRICTQLFNEDCFADMNSNSSDSYDLLGGNKHTIPLGQAKGNSPYTVEKQYLEPRSSLESANEEDIYVPETQEIPAANLRPQTNNVAIVDERCANQCSANSSSQFRICTQIFNEDCFADMNSNSSDSYDLLGGNKHTIPLGQAKASEDEGVEDTEICALNWSSATASNSKLTNSTAAELLRDDASTPDLFDCPEQENIRAKSYPKSAPTPVEVVRDDASTPDLCDFPVEQQQIIRGMLNASSANFVASESANETTAAFKAKTVTLSEPLSLDYDEDIMLTQVYIGKVVDKKPQPQQELQVDIEGPVYLTLSDKENRGPTVMPKMHNEVEMLSTQMFSLNEASSSNLKKSADQANVTNEPQIKQGDNLYDEIVFADTQLFAPSKTIEAAEQSTRVSTKSNNCFNSTLLISEEKVNARNPARFFESPPKSQKETRSRVKDDKFKKPSGAVLSKTSSISSVTSTLDPGFESDMMCTPQFLRDKFVDCSAAELKQSLMSAKQKSLFGDDSEEEDDLLKLINAPKTSKDFDILQPKEQTLLCSDEKSCLDFKLNQQEIEDSKAHKMDLFFGSEFRNEKQAINQNCSREERYTARDNNKDRRLPETELESTKRVPETASTSKRGGKRKSSSKSETVTAAKMLKEDTAKSKITEAKLVEQKSKIYELNIEDEKTLKDDTENDQIKINKKTNMPPKRMTRLRSRAEATEEKEEKVKEDSRATKGPGRPTRTRLTTGSQESSSSAATTSKKSTSDSKRKVLMKPENDSKQPQITSSVDDSNASGSSQSAKLKVSMTMVDPKLFEKLTKNSSGMWIVTSDPMESDILIMDQGSRTFKFLLAMAKGIPIVTSKWLENVNSTRTITTMAEHFFKDASFEKRHKFTLVKSLEQARKRRLFSGYDFLMTPGIQPQPNEMKAILKSAGGIVYSKPPSPVEGTQRQHIYLISTAKEKLQWHKYRRVNRNIRIISSEGVMSSIMRQQVEPLDKFLLE